MPQLPSTLAIPVGSSDKNTPGKVQRRGIIRPTHKLRICRDNRVYAVVPFTIPGTVIAQDYGPMWRADRDYWIARLTANVGKHDTDSHPNDGTPAGQDILINMRRVNHDLDDDSPILSLDSRLRIDENHHQDAINDDEDGAASEDDFAIKRLNEGQHIYPRVGQAGTTRPGSNLVVSIILVPIP